MTLIALGSCINDNQSIDVDSEYAEFTIEEARQYFASQNNNATRSNNQATKSLSPGEYTPLWDKPKFETDAVNARYYIPINAQYRYKAVESTISNGRNKVHTKYIEQQLVISKNLKSGSMALCIITLLPDKDSEYNFSMYKESSYSGMVIYSLPQLNMPLRIERYANGTQLFAFNTINKNGKRLSSKIIAAIFSNYKFLVARSIGTRSGEDFWDWFENEVFPELEDGDHLVIGSNDDQYYIEDQDGHRYTVPDGIIDDDNNWDNDIELYPDLDDDNDGGIIEVINIRHKPCGTIAKTIILAIPGDLPWEGTCYCHKCKESFHVIYY